MEPRLVIMDEPDSGIDVEALNRIFEAIQVLKKNGTTVLLITHNLGRFQLPTTQLEQGWMNTSALSIIDAISLEFVATVLLDEPDRGAAGSWGIACNLESIYVAHSGTHDFSTIDYRALMDKLDTCPDKKSLAYELTFCAVDRSLQEDEVNRLRDEMLPSLKKAIGARLR